MKHPDLQFLKLVADKEKVHKYVRIKPDKNQISREHLNKRPNVFNTELWVLNILNSLAPCDLLVTY